MIDKKGMNGQQLWEVLTSQGWQVEPPVFPALARTRILLSIERIPRRPLNLFTPWGPPYNKRGLNLGKGPEVKTIKKVAAIAEVFVSHGVKINWIFLAADIYGTEINRLGNLDGPPRIKEEIVDKYFWNLKKSILTYIPGARFYWWSRLRSKYNTVYFLSQQECNDERIKQLVGEPTFKQMVRTSTLINRLSSKEESETMALRYLRERICEALIVEEIWHPIKISLAPRKNDEVVDMRLPRLYLVPKELQTPWLKTL